MRRFGLSVLGLAALFTLLASCASPVSPGGGGAIDVPVTAVSLTSGASLTVELGQTLTLTYTMTPTTANTGLTWTSSDTSVAEVSAAGLVSPVALGTVTVTLASTKDPSIKATCSVQVQPVGGIIALADFGFQNQVSSAAEAVSGVVPGTTATKPDLVAQRLALANTDYSSLVKGTLAGNSIVYLAAPQSGNFRIKARVTISAISLASTATSTAGSSDRGVTLGAFVPTVMPTSGEPTIDAATKFATIFYRTRGDIRSFYTDNTGVNSAGSPNITQTAESWHVERILEIARTDAGYSFGVYDSKSGTLVAGGSSTLAAASLDPLLASGSPVYLAFTSGGATVSFSNIEIYSGVQGAETSLFATTAVAASPVAVNGVTVTGTLRNPTASFDYQNSLVGAQADTIQLVAAVNPPYADNLGVTWSSSSDIVASVDATGLVNVHTAGAATITATTADGGFTDTFALNISADPVAVTGITVTGSSSVMVGLTTTLGTTVAPVDATNQGVTWSSANDLVATINSTTGVVTGVNPGDVVITATAADGSLVTGTTTITVTQALNTVFSWTAGAGADISVSSPTSISGKTVVGSSATALNFASTGLVLSGTKFVIGSTYNDTVAGGATLGATTASTNPSDGQFDFSTKKAKVTVTYSSYTPPASGTNTFNVYLDNNTATSANSVHGTACKIAAVHASGSAFVNTGGSVSYTIDPALLTTGTSFLNKAFLQLRTGSGASITITGILVEYLP